MFNTSISGLNGAQKYLDTTSNNIANANSYGFKRSRAEFADLYCNSVFASTKTATGMGVTTTTVAQQFKQGSLSGDTGNNLDMAISGNGFFVLSDTQNDSQINAEGNRTYTRNGAFEINPDGYLVTAMGDYVQGYDIDDEGNVTNLDIASTHAIKIPSTTGAPKRTSRVEMSVNLPANAEALGPNSMAKFDHNDSSTYTNATSQTIHDSLGGTHTLTYYYLKDNVDAGTGETTWNVVTYVDGNPVDLADVGTDAKDRAVRFNVTDAGSSDVGKTYYGMQLKFGTDGKLKDDGMVPSAIFLSNANSNHTRPGSTQTLVAAMGGAVADDQDINIKLDFTQYGSSKFSVSNVTNDGYSTGVLDNVSVNDDGIILAAYSNGTTKAITKLAMANFQNPQGLIKIGDTQWMESINSGDVQPCEANTGMAGAIKGANLELSNVELATELVDLIIAQRTYQANSQALQTQNTAMDSIMNIR
ncbi:MAG: flagellar hook protein FlgE [Succinivibrio sp.]|nr:flagellar hook protein FlgE [Succinivibrio sp.]